MTQARGTSGVSPSVPFLLRSGKDGTAFWPFSSRCQAASARACEVNAAAGVAHHPVHPRRPDRSWRTASLPAVTSIEHDSQRAAKLTLGTTTPSFHLATGGLTVAGNCSSIARGRDSSRLRSSRCRLSCANTGRRWRISGSFKDGRFLPSAKPFRAAGAQF